MKPTECPIVKEVERREREKEIIAGAFLTLVCLLLLVLAIDCAVNHQRHAPIAVAVGSDAVAQYDPR